MIRGAAAARGRVYNKDSDGLPNPKQRRAPRLAAAPSSASMVAADQGRDDRVSRRPRYRPANQAAATRLDVQLIMCMKSDCYDARSTPYCTDLPTTHDAGEEGETGNPGHRALDSLSYAVLPALPYAARLTRRPPTSAPGQSTPDQTIPEPDV